MNFKALHAQYTTHKNVIQQLTGSIASDQLLLRLLQGLKLHAETLDKDPDKKYTAFIENLDYEVDQRTLDRAIKQRIESELEREEEEWLRKQNEGTDPNTWSGDWDEGYIDADGKHHPPYT
jgi:hypothetical protein